MNSKGGKSRSRLNSFPPRSKPHQCLRIDHTSNCGADVNKSTRRRRLFCCGFKPDHWRSSQQPVFYDLFPHFHLACNDDNVLDEFETRHLLPQADAFIFFLCKLTLTDELCLLTLQYAWHLRVPIILLRPPGKQFVLCKIDYQRRSDMRIPGNGSIMKDLETKPTRIDKRSMEKLDYDLLTEIIYEGFQLSVLYDSEQHNKSMAIIRKRINCVVKPTMVDKSTQTDTPTSDASTQTEETGFREKAERRFKMLKEWRENRNREKMNKSGYYSLDSLDEEDGSEMLSW